MLPIKSRDGQGGFHCANSRGGAVGRRHVLRGGRAPRCQEAGALPQRPAHGAGAPRLRQPVRPGGAAVGPGQGVPEVHAVWRQV